jgi:hypothetical protein
MNDTLILIFRAEFVAGEQKIVYDIGYIKVVWEMRKYACH